MFNLFGYDFYKFMYSLDDLNTILIKNNIEVYNIIIDDSIYFYAPLIYRSLILKEPGIEYQFSTGFLGCILRNLVNVRLYLRMILIICIWYFLQNTIFSYEIIGAEGYLKQNIQKDVLQLHFPKFNTDVFNLENILFQKYSDQLSWLEVYREGSCLYIRFSEKKLVEYNEFTKEPLIATKDAVIVMFDIQHGHKIVDVNDFVYRGSILVDGYMLDSNGQVKDLYVKGKVYGYTWYTIDSSRIVDNHNGILFFNLLFDCRNQISKYISNDEKIVKETILKYTIKEDYVYLQVHYTLLEDITVP